MSRTWRYLAIGAVASACVHPPSVSMGDSRHPTALAGQWIDLAHTAPADTMIWVLAPNGNDDNLAIHIAVASMGGVRAVEKMRHYGRWSLSGALADTVRRRLCFVHRPGRDGASCVEFHLDTVSTESGARRRLHLRRYPGEHQNRDRVLIERGLSG